MPTTNYIQELTCKSGLKWDRAISEIEYIEQLLS
jgi:hypothetical protein